MKELTPAQCAPYIFQESVSIRSSRGGLEGPRFFASGLSAVNISSDKKMPGTEVPGILTTVWDWPPLRQRMVLEVYSRTYYFPCSHLIQPMQYTGLCGVNLLLHFFPDSEGTFVAHHRRELSRAVFSNPAETRSHKSSIHVVNSELLFSFEGSRQNGVIY